jgi:hypothetical protein
LTSASRYGERCVGADISTNTKTRQSTNAVKRGRDFSGNSLRTDVCAVKRDQARRRAGRMFRRPKRRALEVRPISGTPSSLALGRGSWKALGSPRLTGFQYAAQGEERSAARAKRLDGWRVKLIGIQAAPIPREGQSRRANRPQGACGAPRWSRRAGASSTSRPGALAHGRLRARPPEDRTETVCSDRYGFVSSSS